MGKVMDFIRQKKDLKIVIMDYEDKDLTIADISLEYCKEHWEVLRNEPRPADFTQENRWKFTEKLYDFIWTEKISEMLIILYLLDRNPTIYQLNRLLKRTKDQYSSTFKAVKKLERLNILQLKDKEGSGRKEKQVQINKNTLLIYGDDEFRRLLIDNWDNDAKEYMEWRFSELMEHKEIICKRIKDGK